MSFKVSKGVVGFGVLHRNCLLLNHFHPKNLVIVMAISGLLIALLIREIGWGISSKLG